jgi:hypothetical protein
MSYFGFDVLPFAGDVALTVVSYRGLNALFRRRRPILAAIMASLFVPMLLAALGMLFLLAPNPGHGDLPGMGAAGCLMLEIFAIPTSLAAGAITFLILGRPTKRLDL